MRTKTLIVAVIGALAAGGMVGGATVALAQADVIKARQDNRKAAGAEMRAIKAVVDAKGDVKTVAANITKLKDQSVQLQIAEQVRIEVARAAVVGYQGQEPVAPEGQS